MNKVFENILKKLNDENIKDKVHEIIENPKVLDWLTNSCRFNYGGNEIDLKLLYGMLKDYFSGDYKQIPWKFLAALVGAFIYLILPMDLVPDILPFVGFTDDVAIFGYVFSTFMDEIEKYCEWKKNNSEEMK
ncbi:MAG: DUF1232 domain-containing protein [Victivallaceae bacterium]|nr:DUF1232 domain-containing protein [Victivallaceae bacterium]